MKNDDRYLEVLKHIVEIFIETGTPASSFAVCEKFENSISSATIRNEMVKLEKMGFVEQPHTSAGRLPTYKGFRLYINNLMHSEFLTEKEKNSIDDMIGSDVNSVSDIIDNATLALADFTNLAVVCTSNIKNFFVICKVDVVETGNRVYAVFVVSSSGEVKNKVCRLNFDVSDEELLLFKKIINESLVGNTIDALNEEFMDRLVLALGGFIYSLSPLLNALYEISNEISKEQIKFKGENNLLKYGGLKSNELIEFIIKKEQIEKILSSAFSGISVIFGKEDDVFALANSSLIITKYGGLKEPLGSFGVIGPIRLNYEKILPYISYFSKRVSALIEAMRREIQGGDGCDKTTEK